jgi:uncharacterized protein (TIGR03083 family)
MDRAAAYRAERAAIVALLRTLDDNEWDRPSRCVGWTVKDVVAHIGAACHGTFTPWVVKLLTGKDVEAANDRDARKRATWEPARVRHEYEVWSGRLAPVQGLLQKPGLRALPIRVAEVGTYPAKLLTSAFVFDHGLHARHDIAVALGRTMEAPDANRIAVANEWMLAGLPTMSGDRLSWLETAVEVDLVGHGGGTFTVLPGEKKVKVLPGPKADAAVRIEAPADTFGVWGTARAPWREATIVLKGDEELGARFLDTMRII